MGRRIDRDTNRPIKNGAELNLGASSNVAVVLVFSLVIRSNVRIVFLCPRRPQMDSCSCLVPTEVFVEPSVVVNAVNGYNICVHAHPLVDVVPVLVLEVCDLLLSTTIKSETKK